MTNNCQNEILIPVDAASEVNQKQSQVSSKRIKGISGFTAGLVSATLFLSGCAQLKPKSVPCHCPAPSPTLKTSVQSPSSKNKLLAIALRLHDLHREAMELASELDIFEQAGDSEGAKKDALQRKPKIKQRLLKILSIIRKYKEMDIKSDKLNSRIRSVEEYIKGRMQDHWGN